MSVFKSFNVRIPEYVEVQVEKGTVKEIKELVNKMNDDYDKNIVLITIKNITEKATELLAKEMVMRNRNVDDWNPNYCAVKNQVPCSSEEAEKIAHQLHTLGSDSIQNYVASDWEQILAAVSEKASQDIEKMVVISSKYTQKERNGKEKISVENVVDTVRFQTHNQDLLSFYKKCFDEMGRHFNKGLQCNPNPAFQRDLVWDEEKKISFIDSIIEQIPLGTFYVNKFDYEAMQTVGEGFDSLLWDGKQRMHALDDFINDAFPVIVNGTSVYYSQFSAYFNRILTDTSVSVYSTRYNNMDDIIHAYIKINRKQTAHTTTELEKARAYLEK